jgi:hypothetical protein
MSPLRPSRDKATVEQTQTARDGPRVQLTVG